MLPSYKFIRIVYSILFLSLFGFLSCSTSNADFNDSQNIPDTVGNDDVVNEVNDPIELKILSLGDSYTIGTSVCDSCSYPMQLKDSLNQISDPIYNTSVEIIATAGWTTTNLISAINSVSLNDNYDLVTLLIGVNNQFQGKPFELFETEFSTLVDTAISLAGNNRERVIVLSIPDYAYTPFGQNFGNATQTTLDINDYNDFAENYCSENEITYLYITDISRNGLNNPYLVASDGLHLSELAYSLIVDRLVPIVRQKVED